MLWLSIEAFPETIYFVILNIYSLSLWFYHRSSLFSYPVSGRSFILFWWILFFSVFINRNSCWSFYSGIRLFLLRNVVLYGLSGQVYHRMAHLRDLSRYKDQATLGEQNATKTYNIITPTRHWHSGLLAVLRGEWLALLQVRNVALIVICKCHKWLNPPGHNDLCFPQHNLMDKSMKICRPKDYIPITI